MKKRSSYKPRPVRMPMMGETRQNLALEIHLAIVGLVGAPSEEGYNSLSKMIGTLRSAGMTGPFMEDAAVTLTAIFRRWEQINAIEVTPEQGQALMAAGAQIDAALPKIDMNDFRRAVAQMTLHCMNLTLEGKPAP